MELREKRASGCGECNVYIKEAEERELGSLSSSITAAMSMSDTVELSERCANICHLLLT